VLRLLAILTFIFAGVNISAQDRFIRFRHLTDSDNLSSNSVLSVCQDHKGFMWFGTRDGLNRYDGYEFKFYYNNQDDSSSISDNQINVIVEDSRDILWIGTGNGLNRFDREKDRFVRFKTGTENYSLSNEYIKTICEDSEGNIWVGTSRGVNILNVETGIVKKTLNIPGLEHSGRSLNVENIFEDSEKQIWVGTRSGLYRSKDGKLEAYQLRSLQNDPSPVWVRKIMEDRQGNFWISTEEDGFFKLNSQTKEVVNYVHNWSDWNSLLNNRVRTMFEDEEGRIWIGTREGLSIFYPQSNEFQNYIYNRYDPTSLSHWSIRDISSDNANGIWIATYAGGLNYYHPKGSIFSHITGEYGTNNTLSSNKISSMLMDKEEILWIGTEGRGLNRYDKNLGAFQHFRNPTNVGSAAFSNIKSITEADNGIFWIGSFGGLSSFDQKTGSYTNFVHKPQDTNSLSFNQIHSTLIDKSGNLWLGTNGGGLDLYDRELKIFKHFPASDDPSIPVSSNINVILESKDGKLWMGTQAGLDCFDPITMKFCELPDIYGPRRILPSFRILCLFEDSRGRLWIGSEGRGLGVLNRNDYSIRYFSKDDGLPSNVVNAILEDDKSNIWISTNRGLSRLSFDESLGDEETRISIRNFNESEGLQGLQFYPRCASQDSEGVLYFGGVNGYNAFIPDNISDTLTLTPIVFTDFKIKYVSAKIDEEGSPLTKDISETSYVKLDYSQREFSITFAGLNYLNPENVYYSYRLDGMNDDWIDLGHQRTITFAFMKAGEYELKVRASDNPNVWGDNYSSIAIELLPSPWKTWWAYMLYTLVGLAIFATIMNYTLRWMRMKNKLALEYVSREKEEELHQMKSRFFTDISHELRTPLTLILTPLENLVSELKDNFKLRNQLMMIQRNGKRMLALINQLLDLRKYETGHMDMEVASGNVAKFFQETTLSFREIAHLKGIQFSFTTTKPEIEAWYDRNKLEIVLYNLLSNAIKATKAGGEIAVEVSETSMNSKDFVKISVQDSGKGIPMELVNKIFNRFYQVDSKETGGALSTGVGLNLAKSMIELHGGSIDVESSLAKSDTPGHTVFTILLPKGKDHFEADHIVEDFKTSEDETLYQKELLNSEVLIDRVESGSKELDQILEKSKDKLSMVIVEDNPEVCMFVKDLFTTKFKVQTAFNGREGLDLILKNPPDIIISDVMMPEMDGIELCRLVKTDKRVSHIPVILLTARTAVTFKHEGLETGADDYILKPFSAEFLGIRVSNLIRQRQIMQEHFFSSSMLKPEGLALTSADEKIMQKAIDNIEQNIDDPDLNVDSLSREVGLSRVHFYRKIKFLTNLTAVEFIRSIRLKKAAQFIENGNYNVSEIRYKVGILDAEYFRVSFKKQFGMTPREYSKQNTHL
jgi:ligand-binding sensor domain-containing protein/signal transduction histidine kinase/DNA-binding response OmpR family regulator